MLKHIQLRIDQAKLLASCSPCPRGQVGAVIYHPESWAVISDGYNGPPRGGSKLCHSDHACSRIDQNIISGQRVEVGCHHAEANAIVNASRLGASTLNAHLAVTRSPCLNCAKLIHHAGIKAVYSPDDGDQPGIDYLIKHDVKVVRWSTSKRDN